MFRKLKLLFSKLASKTKRARIKSLEKELKDLRNLVEGPTDRHTRLYESILLGMFEEERGDKNIPLTRKISDILDHLGIHYEKGDCKPKLKKNRKRK